MTPRRALAVVGWALVVVLCSTAVWGVIRTAGTGVTTVRDVPSVTTGMVPSVAPTPASTRSPRPHPHRHSSDSPKGSSPTSTTTPAPPAPTSTATSGSTGRPVRPGATATPHAPAPPQVRRTWQGAAGAVVASCGGATITFRGAQANSGWRVEVGNRGPEEVEVQFSRHDDDNEREVHVKARCVGGEPRFSTASD